MKFKYYNISLLLFFICIALSIIFFIPYGFNFHEEERELNNAAISVVAPNRGERKIKLEADSNQYWLSCYGFEDLCKEDLINRKVNIQKAKILINSAQKTTFLNGILLDYYDGDLHVNKKYKPEEDSLLTLLAVNAVFSFKLSFIFLILFIFLRIKKI